MKAESQKLPEKEKYLFTSRQDFLSASHMASYTASSAPFFTTIY